MKRKVAIINATSNWGSTGKIVEGIGTATRHRGWEAVVAFGRYSNPSALPQIDLYSHWRTCLHYARSKWLDGEGLGGKAKTKELIGRLTDFAPDIVHLHNIHDHWLHYPLLFEWLKASDVHVVWTFHDCWAFTGGCMYFPVINGRECRQWMTTCVDCTERKGLPDYSTRNFELKKRLFLSLKDRLTLVPVSEWLGDTTRQSVLGGCDIRVIQNGIDIRAFSPCADKRSKHILAVSNVWDARKGLKDVIALRTLLPPEYTMTVIGLDKKQLKDLPDGITGLQRTQSIKELAEEYSKASVLVNTTYQDTFPTVNLEALACGTPVITYRTGGSPEAIDDKTGIVVGQGNIAAMAQAVKLACENPFNSGDCRARAEKHFCKETQFMQYVDLYESLLPK